jgi:hypothetical protein
MRKVREEGSDENSPKEKRQRPLEKQKTRKKHLRRGHRDAEDAERRRKERIGNQLDSWNAQWRG